MIEQFPSADLAPIAVKFDEKLKALSQKTSTKISGYYLRKYRAWEFENRLFAERIPSRHFYQQAQKFVDAVENGTLVLPRNSSIELYPRKGILVVSSSLIGKTIEISVGQDDKYFATEFANYLKRLPSLNK